MSYYVCENDDDDGIGSFVFVFDGRLEFLKIGFIGRSCVEMWIFIRMFSDDDKILFDGVTNWLLFFLRMRVYRRVEINKDFRLLL